MMRQSTLERVHNYAYLGVIVSDDLSLINHVNVSVLPIAVADAALFIQE